MADIIDDDAEWERWMSLSDAEQRREIDAVTNQHNEWWDTLTREQKYRHRRRTYLRLCAGWRRNIKMLDIPTFHAHLKKCQATFIDIRMEYRLGVQGGDA